MKYLITVATCFLVLPSCKSQTKFTGGAYAGSHTSSQFVYIFNDDKTFSLSISGGHFSGDAKGDYYLKSDTLFIVSWPKDKQPSGKNPVIAKETFLIEGDSCIIGLTYGYDYCKAVKQEDYARQSRERKVAGVKKTD